MKKVKIVMSFLMFTLLMSNAQAIEEVAVDTELQLLLDVSGSVNTNEYQLQLDGYSNSFASSNLQQAILSGPIGSIAVQLIMWSGSDDQQVMIDWTLVDSIESSNSLASTIASLARPFAGWTAIGEAVAFGYPQFENNGFSGTQNVVDVSGDGTNNSGMSPAQARALALANGVDTINGIVITNSQAVKDQYEQEVVGGQDAFMLATNNYQTFEQAIDQKLIGEITGNKPDGAVSVPTPNSLIILMLALWFVLRPSLNIKTVQEAL